MRKRHASSTIILSDVFVIIFHGRVSVIGVPRDSSALEIKRNLTWWLLCPFQIKERKFPEFMKQSIGDLDVGTYENISTVSILLLTCLI